jgi:hypothetical protein
MKYLKTYETFLPKKPLVDDDFINKIYDEKIKSNFDITCLQGVDKITSDKPVLEYILSDEEGDDKIRINPTEIKFNSQKLDVSLKNIKKIYTYLLNKWKDRTELRKRQNIEQVKRKYIKKKTSKDPEVNL